MARAYVMDFAGGTSEHYDRVMEDMALGGVLPAGALVHYAGAGPDGWRVVDVWSDPDAFDRFAAERIGPLTARHGLDRPRVEALEVAMQHTGALRPAELVQVVRLPGLDAEGFAAAHARIVPDDQWPQAVVHHVNGPCPEGWMVVDSWASAAEHRAFMESRIGPVMAEAGLSGEPRIEILRVHGQLFERAAAPA